MWNLKKKNLQIHLQNRNRLKDLEIELMVTREKGYGRGIDWDFGVDFYTLLYLKLKATKDPRV